MRLTLDPISIDLATPRQLWQGAHARLDDGAMQRVADAAASVDRIVASSATWVSLHHGGGVGMGYSQHAGMVIVADDAARRLERVLWNDPGTGVMRHAHAGYAIAVDCAKEQGLDLPMIG